MWGHWTPHSWRALVLVKLLHLCGVALHVALDLLHDLHHEHLLHGRVHTSHTHATEGHEASEDAFDGVLDDGGCCAEVDAEAKVQFETHTKGGADVEAEVELAIFEAAVAAVDARRRAWRGGNRGDYVELPAPGVDVISAAAGGGSIVNFSSISYMMGNAGYPIYTAANSGINGMTRSLAREFGPDRIRVTALAPGWVLTQKQKDMWVTEEGLAAHLERQCLKDTLDPDDIIGGTLFLASLASKAMTGQALVIDGGVVVTG